MLAKAMASLSVKERDSTLNDLHGIRSQSTNNDESVTTEEHAEQLAEMDAWMEQHPNDAYKLAKADKNAATYLSSSEFRKYFLQSTDSGTAKDAAMKLLSFFEQKLHLFGKEALCRPITFGDLQDEDRAFLKRGFFQNLGRDSSGRQVIGNFPSQHEYANIDSLVSQQN